LPAVPVGVLAPAGPARVCGRDYDRLTTPRPPCRSARPVQARKNAIAGRSAGRSAVPGRRPRPRPLSRRTVV